MEINIKENGKIIKRMEKEYYIIIMDIVLMIIIQVILLNYL